MAVAITHFKFKTLPDVNAVECLINAVPIVIDTLYPIANQNQLTFQRKTAFDNLALKTYCTYQVHDSVNLIDSNQALLRLNWNGVAGAPASANVSTVILNDAVLNLLSELPLNDVVEFIEVVSIAGVPNMKLNGIAIYVGQRLTLIDILNTIFTAGSTGGGVPYFLLTYLVGRDNTTEVTQYTLQYDIAALALIGLFSGPTYQYYTDTFDDPTPVVYNVTEEESVVEITEGSVYGTAKVTIVINSPFLSSNIWNSVLITIGAVEEEIFANTTIVRYVELDVNGRGIIRFVNYIVESVAGPYTGNIETTLNDIDGNTALVDNPQVNTIVTNIP